jgi:hypothetical protein
VHDGLTIQFLTVYEAHRTTMGIVRGLVKYDTTLSTVIECSDAQAKKHKWMMLPAQMAPMLVALEQRGVAYTRCPGRPHDDPTRRISIR